MVKPRSCPWGCRAPAACGRRGAGGRGGRLGSGTLPGLGGRGRGRGQALSLGPRASRAAVVSMAGRARSLGPPPQPPDPRLPAVSLPGPGRDSRASRGKGIRESEPPREGDTAECVCGGGPQVSWPCQGQLCSPGEQGKIRITNKDRATASARVLTLCWAHSFNPCNNRRRWGENPYPGIAELHRVHPLPTALQGSHLPWGKP